MEQSKVYFSDLRAPVGTNLLRRSKAWQAFSVVLFLALLLLCIALMMNDTYSTFLYFQF